MNDTGDDNASGPSYNPSAELNGEQLKRIVAVGLPLVHANLEKLRRDLEGIADGHATARQLKPSQRKREIAGLGKMVTAAKNLRSTFTNVGSVVPVEWTDSVNEIVEWGSVRLAKLEATLPSIDSAIERRITTWSPFDYIVGNRLPRIYERHFGRAPGASLINDKADGPYVRFAHRSLIELGISNGGRPYEKTTIRTSFQAVQAGYRARKSKTA